MMKRNNLPNTDVEPNNPVIGRDNENEFMRREDVRCSTRPRYPGSQLQLSRFPLLSVP